MCSSTRASVMQRVSLRVSRKACVRHTEECARILRGGHDCIAANFVSARAPHILASSEFGRDAPPSATGALDPMTPDVPGDHVRALGASAPAERIEFQRIRLGLVASRRSWRSPRVRAMAPRRAAGRAFGRRAVIFSTITCRLRGAAPSYAPPLPGGVLVNFAEAGGFSSPVYAMFLHGRSGTGAVQIIGLQDVLRPNRANTLVELGPNIGRLRVEFGGIGRICPASTKFGA